MKHLKLCLFLITASLPAISNLHAAEFQTYMEFRATQEGAKGAGTKARKLWRSGTRYARIEEPIDPNLPVELATIIAEPNVYMVDLKTKRGRHVVDPDPRGQVHVPLFVGKSTTTMLEAGHEYQFFKAKKASRLPDEELNGQRCARFQVRIDGQRLTLFVDLEERVPRRILFEGPKGAYSIWYDQYVRKEPFDPELYKPPEGFVPVEDAVPEEIFNEIDTPFKKIKNDALQFLAFDAESQTFMGDHLCRGRPILLYMFDPEGALGSESVGHLTRLHARYSKSALCLVPLPVSSGSSSHAGLGFRVYELQMMNGVKSQPLDILKHLASGVVPAAMVIDRANVTAFVTVLSSKDFPLIDAKIEKAFKEKMASDEEEETLDPALKIEDMKAVQLRVEGELHSEELTRLAEILENKDFAGADAMFSEWRKNKTRGTNGSWILSGAYDNSVGGLGGEAAVLKRMDLMREWIKFDHASPTPRILLAKLWIKYAWIGRGGGWANDLTERQKTLFSERLAKAHEILTQAKELDEQCPELYTVMVELGMGEGWPRDAVDEIFRQGRAVEPHYQYLYKNMARYLLPKWGGGPGEWEAFLDRNASKDPAGDEVYARAALLLKDEPDFGHLGQELFIRSRLSWDRIRRGYARIVSKYPAKKLNLNQFAFMACAAGDRKTAREVFAKVGNDYAQSIWGNAIVFDHARRWAKVTSRRN